MNESDGGSADVTCLWHATWTQDGSKVKELVVFSAPHTAIPVRVVPLDCIIPSSAHPTLLPWWHLSCVSVPWYN